MTRLHAFDGLFFTSLYFPHYWQRLIEISAIRSNNWSNNCDRSTYIYIILWIQGQNWHTYSLALLCKSVRLQKAMTDQSESGNPESCVITTICCYTDLVLTNKQRIMHHNRNIDHSRPFQSDSNCLEMHCCRRREWLWETASPLKQEQMKALVNLSKWIIFIWIPRWPSKGCLARFHGQTSEVPRYIQTKSGQNKDSLGFVSDRELSRNLHNLLNTSDLPVMNK